MDSRVGSEITVAGIVTEVVHRVTKNGKPFGILTVEGYDDSHSFYLFSDNYHDNKKFMVVGWFLFIKGVVIIKQWGDQRPEFNISKIEELSEVREKYSKSILVDIKPKSISHEIINQLEELLSLHPGKCSFKLNLIEESENISVDLLSRKFMVSPNDDLLNSLKDIPELHCKVTT